MNKNQLSEHKRVFEKLKIKNPQLIGSGMEGFVYDYSVDTIVKIWKNSHHDTDHLSERKSLYEVVSSQLQVEVPEIYEVGITDDLTYTIEKKLFGKSGHTVFLNSTKNIKKKLLDNYYDLLLDLKSVQIGGDYGQILTGSHGKAQAETWTEFLKMKLEETKSESILKPDHDIKDIKRLFNRFYDHDLIKLDHNPTKHLVHGDIFLENIMASEGGEITGLLDFGPLTVIGDHLMDVTALTHFASVTEGVESDTTEYLFQKTKQAYSDDLEKIRIYLGYYSLLFINSKSYDPRTYDWCLNNLKRLGYL